MCCKLEIFVMAPVGTQFEHNQGDSDQHGPCQSSWFTGADSSQNVMKKCEWTNFSKSRVHLLLTSYLTLICLFSVCFFFFRTRCPSVFQFLSFICNFSWHLRGWHQRRWYHWKWRGAKNSSSVRTHLCQFLYSQHIFVYDLCIHCIAVPSFHWTRCASSHPREDRIWVDVPFVPDSLVLNVGALLSRWTGNTWKASVHRPSEKIR